MGSGPDERFVRGTLQTLTEQPWGCVSHAWVVCHIHGLLRRVGVAPTLKTRTEPQGRILAHLFFFTSRFTFSSFCRGFRSVCLFVLPYPTFILTVDEQNPPPLQTPWNKIRFPCKVPIFYIPANIKVSALVYPGLIRFPCKIPTNVNHGSIPLYNTNIMVSSMVYPRRIRFPCKMQKIVMVPTMVYTGMSRFPCKYQQTFWCQPWFTLK